MNDVKFDCQAANSRFELDTTSNCLNHAAMNEDQYQTVLGRLDAMEVLISQSLGILLLELKDEQRQDFANGLQIPLEDRFERISPIAQRSALDASERMISSALRTAKDIETELGGEDS